MLVLLISASTPTWIEHQGERAAGRQMTYDAAEAGPPAAVLGVQRSTIFQGQYINGRLLQPQRPDAPLPTGLDHYPAPGELVVSPALRELLARPDSALLRERLPGTIVGTIGDDGLVTPAELYYYGGTAELTEQTAESRVVDHYGETAEPDADAGNWVLVPVGATALLLPVVVFVISTTRLAEAARQRRLAALRLVGASAWQVRRIASGETLIGALAGVLAGWALFGGAHLALSRFETSFVAVFVADLTPVWWIAVLITIGVPALTVLISLAALRGAVHDPLGSVRRSTPARRRWWPRAASMALGITGLLVSRLPLDLSTTVWGGLVVLSVTLLLLSVPLLLPWVVETATRNAGRGPLAWQLALRRLHLTSGTAARSVSAIAVVATGVIALQTMIGSLEQQLAGSAVGDRTATISGNEDRPDRNELQHLRTELATMPGVDDVRGYHRITVEGEPDRTSFAVIADCDLILRTRLATDCRDGDTFAPPGGGAVKGDPPRTGETWFADAGPGRGRAPFPIPALRQSEPDRAESGIIPFASLVITPAAAASIPIELRSVDIDLALAATAPPDVVERIRNLAEANLEGGSVVEIAPTDAYERSLAKLRLIKTCLLLAAMVVFSLIGCSLLVTAVEQIQERSRPMAVLGAVGAKRSTLVWSAFLQNAVPMLLATAIAVPAGYGLGALIYATDGDLPALDLPGAAAVVGFAAVSVLVVTALTAPALTKAMNTTGLHAE